MDNDERIQKEAAKRSTEDACAPAELPTRKDSTDDNNCNQGTPDGNSTSQQRKSVVDMLESLGTIEKSQGVSVEFASFTAQDGDDRQDGNAAPRQPPTEFIEKRGKSIGDQQVPLARRPTSANANDGENNARPASLPPPLPQTREPVETLAGAFPVQGVDAPSRELLASLEFGVSEEESSPSPQPNSEAFSAALVESESFTNEAIERSNQEVLPLDAIVPLDAAPTTHTSGSTMEEEPKWQLTKSKRFNIGCLLLIVGIFLAILLGLVLKPEDTKDDESIILAADNNQSGIIFYPPFNETLWPVTKKIIAEDPNSPFYYANAWMVKDPHLDSYPLWRQMQRFSWATKYFIMQGDKWFHNDHWLSYEVSECNWWSRSTEAICNEKGEIVIEDLSANNLNGSTLHEVQLPTLKFINNSENHIQGRLQAIYSDKDLEVLILSNNQLVAPLAASGEITGSNMRILKLNGNRLEGTPLIFRVFPRLEVVDLTDNLFHGSLPAAVMKSQNLTQALLGENLFTGTLPTELGTLDKLQELDVSGNVGISGAIPSQLGLATSLHRLDVEGTSITGTIPPELCNLNISIVANCSQLRCC